MNMESIAPYVGAATSFLGGMNGQKPAQTPTAPPVQNPASGALIQGAGTPSPGPATQNPAALAGIIQALMGGKPQAMAQPGQPSPMGGALFSQPPMSNPGMGPG